jgi:hypothetical protein
LLRLLLILGLLLSVALNCALLFRFVWTGRTRARTVMQRLLLFVFAAAFTLWTLELVFFQFAVFSDGMGQTLAARRWLDRHWHPLNAIGLRDREHRLEEIRAKQVLVVVGDSFAAGHGIESIEERFAGVLQQELGRSWEVVVLADNGWHTGRQLQALREFPVSPDVVVWSYFINDIEGAAAKIGKPMPVLVEPPSALANPLIERSHLANFFYWRFVRRRDIAAASDSYLDFLSSSFADPQIWELHRAELAAMSEYAASKDAALLAVVFPHLMQTDRTAPLVERILKELRVRDIPVVNVLDMVSGRATESLVVSRYDAHPSPQLHQEVGVALSKKVLTTESQ